MKHVTDKKEQWIWCLSTKIQLVNLPVNAVPNLKRIRPKYGSETQGYGRKMPTDANIKDKVSQLNIKGFDLILS